MSGRGKPKGRAASGTRAAASPRAYSEETKAAVMAALLAGQSVTRAAEAYRIPLGTVKMWSASLAERRAELKASQPEPTTKNRIGALLVEYLEASLTALRAQVDAFADPAWIKTQSAADAAVLHGVLTDKAVRLLEALGGPPPAAPDADEDLA